MALVWPESQLQKPRSLTYCATKELPHSLPRNSPMKFSISLKRNVEFPTMFSRTLRGHHADLITHHPLLGLHHSFVLASLMLLRHAKRAPPQGLCTCCTGCSLHISRRAPESSISPYRVPAFALGPESDINFHHFHSITLYPLLCFVFLCKMSPPGILDIFLFVCLLAISSQRDISRGTELSSALFILLSPVSRTVPST